MKKISVVSAVLLALGLLTSPASAVYGTMTALVDSVNAQDTVIVGANTDYATLVGLTSYGSCGTSGGFVVLRIRNDVQGRGMLSILLAAKLAGKPVKASFNDSNKDSFGACWLQAVTLP